MLRPIFQLLVLGGLFSGFIGCSGEFNNEPEIDGSGTTIGTFSSSQALTFPSSGIDVMTIAPGNYNLTDFSVYVNDTNPGNTRQAFVQRILTTSGQITQNDTLTLSADWSGADTSQGPARIDLQLNLPLGLVSTLGATPQVNFLNSTHYYWQMLMSDGTSQFRYFNNVSGAGNLLYSIFTNPSPAFVPGGNNIYQNVNLAMNAIAGGTTQGMGTAQQSGNITTLWFQVQYTPTEVLVLKLNYGVGS